MNASFNSFGDSVGASVLTTLGYSPREATFLRVVAVHSGVFLRRQYVAYTGGGPGNAVQTLVTKLLSRGHGRAISFGDNKTVYHLTYKGIYRLLGIEDSNNRRARSASLLKSRLMALDFILDHAEGHFLETEQEKTDFFARHFGAKHEQLPLVVYPARQTGAGATSRAFIEKFPILIGPGASPQAKPEVAFSFIDDGQATVSSFAAFLHRYSSLMALIPRFRLFYVADALTKFAPGQRQFERLITGAASGGPPAQPDTLLRYFELLNRWREGTTRFNSDQFAELGRLRRLYNGLEYDALFEKWQVASFSAFPPVVPMKVPPSMAPKFVPTLLDHDYRFLGEVKTSRDGESHPRSAALSVARSPKLGRQSDAGQGVAATTKSGSGQPPQQATTKPHAVSDPVVTGFGSTDSGGGQSFAIPRARDR